MALIRLERQQGAAAVNAAAVGDVGRPGDSLRQWMLMGDLIYGSGETYLTEGAVSQTDQIRGLIAQLRDSGLGQAFTAGLDAMDARIRGNEGRLLEAARARTCLG